MEIYTSKDGEVIFKKYSLMGDLEDLAEQFCEALSKNAGLAAAICDRDSVIAVSGGGKRELIEKRISPDIEKLLEDRKTYTHAKNERCVFVTDGNDKYFALIAVPVLTEGDVMGCVLFIADSEEQRAGETEIKLAQTVAAFLGKHMES